jgi:hypothetical protein
MKKFFAIFCVALLSLVGCENPNGPTPGGGDSSDIAGEWHIVDWNGEAPVFDVYVEFKGGSFNIYQQVYSLYYEHYEGTYNVSDDIITGTYADGSNWACGYKFSVADGKLTLMSQEDTSIVSIYEKCTIPQEIKDEAATTRASDSKPIF